MPSKQLSTIMGMKLDLPTRLDVEKAGEAFLTPGGDSVPLMANEIWGMVRTNPTLTAEHPVAATLSRDDTRGARIALAHHPLVCGGREIPCFWGHGLFAHEKVRAFGFGGLLLRGMIAALAERGSVFAAYGPNATATPLLAAVGMKHLGLVRRYVLPLRANPIVRHFLKSRALAQVVAVPLNWGRRGWIGMRRRALAAAGSALTATECDLLGDADVPSSLSADGRVRVKRTAALVNWRVQFARSVPGAQVRVFTLADPSGAPVGYFAARVSTHAVAGSRRFRDVRIFRVLDLVAPGEGNLAAALNHLLAAAQGCDVVEIISTAEETRDLCERTGFIESNGYELLVSRVAGVPEEVYDFDAWFLNLLEAEPAFYSG